MNRIRLISLLCFLLICPLAAPAQVRIISREKLDSVSNPKLAPNSNALEFDKLHITAEPMTEDDSPESFTYTFRNKSQSSLTISRIVSTCSCVQATCDRKEVAPGEYATVKVIYNPKGHPGNFERKIFVYTAVSYASALSSGLVRHRQIGPVSRSNGQDQTQKQGSQGQRQGQIG